MRLMVHQIAGPAAVQEAARVKPVEEGPDSASLKLTDPWNFRNSVSTRIGVVPEAAGCGARTRAQFAGQRRNRSTCGSSGDAGIDFGSSGGSRRAPQESVIYAIFSTFGRDP